ncbi:type I-E CRISPR-associated protein Cse2/CasB [Streptomyces kunmingensis]|uniref:Type I-E CRISPR-associated protein Cse2/CasB n=1 Tax=Streptomyces kunmingensis TaxID=68225 RepID=A0ABU6CPI4_9ACTN|nr:type I-E CRISPR-associated protein Cse2/CasB [Streptomyces kunmingensis]MEB3966349.1 type I-E CRISPR-associated protein Cse2/CasB [Streptomyces kunmingensis]
MTASPDARPTASAGEQLTAWLISLVRSREVGKLADLRRPHAETEARIMAGWVDPANRETLELVAFLFAVYHRGSSRPSYGSGSLGTALRRIGSGDHRGPADPGAARLMERIAASRRLPVRHLQHAVARLRSCEQKPPAWSQLTDDLIRWNDRRSRIRYGWAVDFYEPARQSSRRAFTPPTDAEDDAQ